MTAYSCEGTEEFLEDCQEVEVTSEEEKAGGMGVICKEGEDKVGEISVYPLLCRIWIPRSVF